MGRQARHFYEFGPFRLEPDEGLLLRQGEVVPLPPKAFEMLVALVEENSRLLRKEELLRRIWPDSIVEEANLSHNIYKLREALGEGPNGERYIETVPRRGYRFVAHVTEGRETEARDILVAEETRTHVVFEYERPDEADRAFISQPSPALLAAPERQRRIRTYVLASLGLLVLMLSAGYLIRRWINPAHASPAAIKSMAVLPFRPIMADNRDETLELGMADTLINRLSSLQQVTIRPVSSVRKYTDLQQDALIAGRELGVDSVLDGSIQRAGDQLRVNVRLLRVADGSPLWAEQFDEKYTNIFAVQDTIAERVAQSLALGLSTEDRGRLLKRYTGDPRAYELYLLGRYFCNQSTADSLNKSITYFQQAIEKDGQYAQAYAGLADAYNALGLWDFMPANKAFPQATAAAQKALALDNSLAEAHADLAYAKFRYEWDYQTAEQEYKEAISLSPNDAEAYYLYGEFLAVMQRNDEAAQKQKRALELDPLSLPNRMMIAVRLYFMRQYDQAIPELRQIIEVDPNFVVAYDLMWASYRQQGMFSESVKARLQSLKLQGYSAAQLAALQKAFESGNVQAFWRKDIELIQSHVQQRTSPFIFIAMNYAQLGDKDQAFVWLGKACDQRNSWLPELKVDPVWDNLRSDARFAVLLERVNLK
jgi:DNA-binding winged helix-turn-helix (wHTH) protein/TolB-like protein/cytochrome c-type biogenesis protein CcmH/NrfG